MAVPIKIVIVHCSNELLHLDVTRQMTITQKYLESGHTQMECDE